MLSEASADSFKSMFNESDVGCSIKIVECIRNDMTFSEVLQGLSVHPVTDERKRFQWFFVPPLDTDAIEKMVFEILFDLEWAWRSPGKNWLERAR